MIMIMIIMMIIIIATTAKLIPNRGILLMNWKLKGAFQSTASSTSTALSFDLPHSLDMIKVGRHEDCLVRLSDDQSVSRIHAVLWQCDAKLFVKDCESKFGTFLNGKKLAPNKDFPVQHNDLIKFGAVNSEFRVQRANSEHSPPQQQGPLSKREIADLLVGPLSATPSTTALILQGIKYKNFDRKTLFQNMNFKRNSLCDLILKCGGSISEHDDNGIVDWSEDDILEAIINGKMKTKAAQTYTTIAEMTLPKFKSSISTVDIAVQTVPCANFKKFRKIQPNLLPEIIGSNDMTAHRSGNSASFNQDNGTLTRQSHNPSTTIEQCFGNAATNNNNHLSNHDLSSTANFSSSRAKVLIEAHEFQTDFFKNLL